jgi:2-polyprenyl-3-methyl-5-hydroxy-6-metoxy-1,4-benzoquinol methylase
VNKTAFDLAVGRSQADIQRAAHYSSEKLTRKQLASEVEANLINVRNLVSITGVDPSCMTFCDFGAGRGCTSLAASSLFRTVYSIDFDTDLLGDTTSRFPELISNVVIGSDLTSVKEPIDFFLAWHSLEHLPDPTSFFDGIHPLLSPGAVICLQVPLFRPAHLMDCHYVFYTPATFVRQQMRWGYRIQDVPIDVANGFLTLIARAVGRAGENLD